MPKGREHPGIREHHGRYQVRYRDAQGVQHARSFRLVTDARHFKEGVRTDVKRGGWIDPAAGQETFGSFWQRWVERAIKLDKPGERTRIGYEELWRLYIEPALGRRQLASITRADVADLVAKVGERSAWRATDVLKVVRMLLNRAVVEEKILRNPAARVPAPRIDQGEPWVLTPDEVERLAEAIEDRYRALVLFAAYSSLRWSELIAVRVNRIDMLRRRVRVEEKITEHGRLIFGEPKTRQSRRSVAIPEFVCLELAEHLRRYPPGPDGLVFSAPAGGPLRRPHFGRAWHKATTAATLEGFRFGNLRHTGASLAIAAGANPLLVAHRLGHTSTRMVERHYVSLFEGLDREIGERLGVMRADRTSQSLRLRSPEDVDQMWTKRGSKASSVAPLRAEEPA